MLDIKFILKNKEWVARSIKEKNVDCDLEMVLSAYQDFKNAISTLENLQSESNLIASQIPKADDQKKIELSSRGTEVKNLIKEATAKHLEAEEIYKKAMSTVPNVLAPDTPLGQDDSANVLVGSFMQPTVFDFKPKDHVTLGQELDLIDFETGAKVAGSKFYFLKNEAVLLDLALKHYAITKAIKHGFTPIQTPDVARNEILLGSGYSPRGNESNTYRIEDSDLSLIATSEIAIGGYHSNGVLKETDLPLKYIADSHCFRTEAGGAGKASKGLYRVHQFSKIELYVFSAPDDSDKMLDEILALEEEIYRGLEIPYRVMLVCSGDMGAPAYKKYDIEAWMPGKGEAGEYGEITSASNCTDFQARRLNIKYKDSATRKNQLVHTLNGTAIALSRTFIAIMENYQTAAGEILIPEVLRPLVGLDKIKASRTIPTSTP